MSFVGDIIYSINSLLPLALIAGMVTNKSFFGIYYAMCFMLLLYTKHVFLPIVSSKWLYIFLGILITCSATSSVFGFLGYLNEQLPIEVNDIFGIEYDQPLPRSISDIIICSLSIISIIIPNFNKNHSKLNDSYYPNLSLCIFIVTTCLIPLFDQSVITIPYMVVIAIYTLLVAYSNITTKTILRYISILIRCYEMAHILLMCIVQNPYILRNLNSDNKFLFGLEDMTSSDSINTTLSFICLTLSTLSSKHCFEQEKVRYSTSNDPIFGGIINSTHDASRKLIINKIAYSFYKFIDNFITSIGRVFCLATGLFFCYTTNSGHGGIFPAILLFIIFLTAFVPQTLFKTIGPLVNIVFVLYSFIHFCIIIILHFIESPTTIDKLARIGFSSSTTLKNCLVLFMEILNQAVWSQYFRILNKKGIWVVLKQKYYGFEEVVSDSTTYVLSGISEGGIINYDKELYHQEALQKEYDELENIRNNKELSEASRYFKLFSLWMNIQKTQLIHKISTELERLDVNSKVGTSLKIIKNMLMVGSWYITLLFLYFAAMSSVNVINGIFLILFIVFLLSKTLSQFIWPLFVTFGVSISFASYVLQFDVFPNDFLYETLGLSRHTMTDTDARQKPIINETYAWILLTIYSYFFANSHQYSTKVNTQISVNILTNTVKKIAVSSGYLLCYLSLLLAAFVENVSILQVIYFGLFFILIFFDINTSAFKSIFLLLNPIILLIFIILLTLRYLYQFEQYGNVAITPFFDIFKNTSLLMNEWGFEIYTTYWSRLFHLLPSFLCITTFIMQFKILLFVTLKTWNVSMEGQSIFSRLIERTVGFIVHYSYKIFQGGINVKKEYDIMDEKSAASNIGSKRLAVLFANTHNFVLRVLAIYAPTISIIVLAAFFLYDMSATHFSLLVVLVLSCFSSKGVLIASGNLLLLAFVFTISEVLFNFSIVYDNIVYGNDTIFKWIGIYTCNLYPFENYCSMNSSVISDDGVYYVYPNIWETVKEYAIIGLIIWFLNSIDYWKRTSLTKKLTLFILPESYNVLHDPTFSLNKLKFILNNFFSIFAFPIIFVAFCLAMALHGQDIMGIFYMVIIQLFLFVSQKSIIKHVLLPIQIFISIVIVVSYFITLGFPPIYHEFNNNNQITTHGILKPNRVDMWKLLRHQDETDSEYVEVAPFPQLPRNQHNNIIFLFSENSWILIYIMDLVSFIYISFALIIYFTSTFFRGNKWLWTFVRVLNWCLLVLQILFIALGNVNTYDDVKGFDIIQDIGTIVGFETSIGTSFYIQLIIFIVISFRDSFVREMNEEILLVESYVEGTKQKKIILELQRMNGEALNVIKQSYLKHEDKKRRYDRLKMFRRLRTFVEKKFERSKDVQCIEDSEKDYQLSKTDERADHVFQEYLEMHENMNVRIRNRIADISDEVGSISEENIDGDIEDDVGESKTQKGINFVNKWFYYGVDIFLHKLHGNGLYGNLVARDWRLALEKKNVEEIHGLKKDLALEDSPTYGNSENLEEAVLNNQYQPVEVETLSECFDIPHTNVQLSTKNPYGTCSRWKVFYLGLRQLFIENTKSLCVLIFLLNMLFNSSLLSVVFMFFGLCVVIISPSPFPGKMFWDIMSVYCIFDVLVKYLYQIPGFCICQTESNISWYFTREAIYTTPGDCGIDKCNALSTTTLSSSYPYLIGIYSVGNIFGSVFLIDLLTVFMIFLHRNVMQSKGYWSNSYYVHRKITEHRIENIRLGLQNELSSILCDCPECKQQQKRLGTCSFDCLLCKKHLQLPLAPFKVKATKSCDSVYPDYLSFNKNDQMTVLQCRADGTLFCILRFGEIEQRGYVNSEDVFPQKFEQIQRTGETHEHEETPNKIREQFGDLSSENSMYCLSESEENIERFISNEESEEDFEESTISNAFSLPISIFNNIKNFYTVTLKDRFKTGADFYTASFVCEIICFIYLVFFQSFTGIGGTIFDFIFGDNIPTIYVVILLLQFLGILADRIIFLLKSVLWKMILHYTTLFIYSILFFVYFPIRNGEFFYQSTTLVIFFLFKCCYWILGGYQIQKGFVSVQGERLIMKKATFYPSLIYTAYRAIPFLFELQTILDWMFTKTALRYHMYLKQEDIHAELYKTQVQRSTDLNKNHHYGQTRNVLEKFASGCWILALIVIALWAPLFIMSSSSPGMKIPDIYSAQLKVSVAGYPELYTQMTTDTDGIEIVQREHYENLLKLDEMDDVLSSSYDGSLFLLSFENASQQPWVLTSPIKQKLLTALTNTSIDMTIKLTLTITREESAGPSTFEMTKVKKLSETTRTELSKQILGTDLELSEISLGKLMPSFVELGSLSSTMTELTDAKDVLLMYQESTSSWWDVYMNSNPEQRNGNSQNTPYVFIIGVPVNVGILSSLAANGIIGIYCTVVIAIGQFVRSGFSGQAHTIIYSCMPQCYYLLQFCKDLITARHEENFEMEEDINWEIISIYRRPNLLLEYSKREYNPYYLKKKLENYEKVLSSLIKMKQLLETQTQQQQVQMYFDDENDILSNRNKLQTIDQRLQQSLENAHKFNRFYKELFGVGHVSLLIVGSVNLGNRLKEFVTCFQSYDPNMKYFIYTATSVEDIKYNAFCDVVYVTFEGSSRESFDDIVGLKPIIIENFNSKTTRLVQIGNLDGITEDEIIGLQLELTERSDVELKQVDLDEMPDATRNVFKKELGFLDGNFNQFKTSI
ncbi:SH3 domain-containing protein [Entamoeba marina]